MQVEDTFHFEDGRTVFVGTVKSDENIITACDCEIVFAGVVKLSLWIDGEEIPKGKKSSKRAISTRENIELGRYGIGESGFEIRSKKLNITG